MELTPYVDNLRNELAVAAAAGGDDARALAERLTGPLESATRLALLEALTAAAAEITRDLAPGSVEIRLRGREPDFVVTPPPVDQPYGDDTVPTTITPVGGTGGPVVPDSDEAATARINFRLPDHLKGRIEEAAGREGLSVNAWLVRITTAAVSGTTGTGTTSDPTGYAGRRAPRGAQRYTGWVR